MMDRKIPESIREKAHRLALRRADEMDSLKPFIDLANKDYWRRGFVIGFGLACVICNIIILLTMENR